MSRIHTPSKLVISFISSDSNHVLVRSAVNVPLLVVQKAILADCHARTGVPVVLLSRAIAVTTVLQIAVFYALLLPVMRLVTWISKV